MYVNKVPSNQDNVWPVLAPTNGMAFHFRRRDNLTRYGELLHNQTMAIKLQNKLTKETLDKEQTEEHTNLNWGLQTEA